MSSRPAAWRSLKNAWAFAQTRPSLSISWYGSQGSPVSRKRPHCGSSRADRSRSALSFSGLPGS